MEHKQQNYYKSMSIVGYLTIFLLFVDNVSSLSLQPNYNNYDHKLVVFDDRVYKPLILSCNITGDSGDAQDNSLSWTRNGKYVSEDPQLKNRYEIIDKENKFIIAKPDELDAGLYACTIDKLGIQEEIKVMANVYIKKLQNSIAVVEGEKLRIHCKVFGSNPIITWHIDEDNYTETEGRIVISDDENNIKNAVLIIEQTILEDRKHYNCSVTNDAIMYGNAGYSPDSTHTYVRVKGKLAALWPFLGICAEVFVLCAIILIYEKKRNKAELDESDTDQSPEQEKLKNAKK